jgi:uncharacterized coiled-coil DUF342 family protein
MYDLIDLQREEREQMNQPPAEDLVMIINEEIEKAVELYKKMLAGEWTTGEELNQICKWKEHPYFEELLNQRDRAPETPDEF